MSSAQDIWLQKFKKKEEIVSREIAGETILVPIKGKLADMQRIFALDNVSEFIWQQLNGKASAAEILSSVMDIYGIDKEQAKCDISEFINELLDAELIIGVD